MLELYKEQERQGRLNEESVQRKRNIIMRDYYQGLKRKEQFNESMLNGEKIRDDLKHAAQTLQNKECTRNINLSEESLGKQLGE
ncbi:uncharacterized protein TNCT_411211 [Trichonephila clavata]|uniref:Uncharacterized protein n=1 Tax=Trichonephila clavata TaxID=2740835 RepID=A0A8X6HKN2_TRICU|nr:uncharacterized protein TNCT_411211 [Trichonephila clavata]